MTNQTPSASGPKTPRRELLEEAADLIDGDRNVTYGSPTQNFTNIAELWTTRFSHMLKDGESFTAADVADAMILVKVARNIANKKRDNWADIAGYAGCGYEASLDEPSSPNQILLNVETQDDVDPTTVAEQLRAEMMRGYQKHRRGLR